MQFVHIVAIVIKCAMCLIVIHDAVPQLEKSPLQKKRGILQSNFGSCSDNDEDDDDANSFVAFYNKSASKGGNDREPATAS